MKNDTGAPAALRGLHLEDSAQDAELVREILGDAEPRVNIERAADEKEFRALLGSGAYDIILCDFNVPGTDGFASVRLAAGLQPGVPVICISGTIGEETAVEVLKAGAVDYIMKDRLARLPSAIARAIAEARDKNAGRQAAEALRRTKKEMDDFLYIFSHDLRSPLLNIQGFSRNLVRDFRELGEILGKAGLPDDLRAPAEEITGGRIPVALGYITESTLKMNQLIDSILKIYRFGRVEMKPVPVDPGAVVANVIKNIRFQLEEAGGMIKTGTLPPCKADPDAVNHIFTNLLGNSVKYRDKNRRLEIMVQGEHNSASTALYVVSDNGAGIKPERLEHIWQIFYDGKPRAAGSGEGIGLASCRILTEKNGGRVWAESREGEGSDFYVELPA